MRWTHAFALCLIIIGVALMAQNGGPGHDMKHSPSPPTGTGSQPSPSPVPVPAPKISEAAQFKLLSIYQRAFMLSANVDKRRQDLCDKDQQCNQNQQRMRQAIEEYTRSTADVIRDEKLPEGTGFNVDMDNGKVNVVVPTKK